MLTVLRDKFKAELHKMHAMTWRQRLGYVKDYYTVSFVVCLLVAVTIVAFVQGFWNREKDSYLNCAVLEYTGVYSALERAGEDYLKSRNAPDGERTSLKEETASDRNPEADVSEREAEGDARFCVFDHSDITTRGLETGHDFQKFQGLSAQLSVGDVDIIFMTKEMLLFLQKKRDGYFLPLTEIYTPEELERLGELVCEIPDENGHDYPAAIDVSRWEALEGCVSEESPLYAAIVAGGTHREHAAAFLREMSENKEE